MSYNCALLVIFQGVWRIGKKTSAVIKWAVSSCVAIAAAALLVDAPAVSEGIKKGLGISAGVLIPSLFPFMVLCGFVSMTEFGRVLALPLGWLTQKVYKLPRDMGTAILLSMIGGYPVGAKMISGLLAQKRIDRKTAERMLCFCVNAGPSFLITAVGTGMFLSRAAGIILFLTQIVSTILVGAVVSLGASKVKESDQKSLPMKISPAFVLSVTGASTSMMTLCAFAVFFSGILQMIGRSGFTIWISSVTGLSQQLITAVINGLFEVTSGCLAAARIGGAGGFAMASAFVSFGGVSVIFQIISFFRDDMIRMGTFLLSKVLHMVLSAGISFFLYNKFCVSQNVWAALQQPEMLLTGRTALITVCLLGMSTILLLSIGKQGGGSLTATKK